MMNTESPVSPSIDPTDSEEKIQIIDKFDESTSIIINSINSAEKFLSLFNYSIDEEGYIINNSGEYVTPHGFSPEKNEWEPLNIIYGRKKHIDIYENLQFDTKRLNIENLYGININTNSNELIFIPDSWRDIKRFRENTDKKVNITTKWETSSNYINC